MDAFNENSFLSRGIVVVMVFGALFLCMLSFGVTVVGPGANQMASSWFWPTYRLGNTSQNIKTIQYMLRAHRYNVPVTGKFDAQTEQAVKSFQASSQLPATGVVAAETWMKLIVPTIKGSTGDAVTALQQQLKDHTAEVDAGSVTLNGTFDTATQQTLTNYQNDNMQRSTGVADLMTWNSLVQGDSTSDPNDPLASAPLPTTLGPMPARVAAIIKWAQSKLGTPYFLGGQCQPNNPRNPADTTPFANPKAVTSVAERCDCAALTQSAYKYGGHLNIPHTVDPQLDTGPHLSLNQIQPGDLLMPLGSEGGHGHVGMYIGNLTGWGDHMIIVAPHSGAYVRYESLDPSYYQHIQSSKLYWVNKADVSSYWRHSYVVRPTVLSNALAADKAKNPQG